MDATQSARLTFNIMHRTVQDFLDNLLRLQLFTSVYNLGNSLWIVCSLLLQLCEPFPDRFQRFYMRKAE